MKSIKEIGYKAMETVSDLKKIDKRKATKSTLTGVGLGSAITFFSRLPVLGMMIDYSCPERGGAIASGLLGAIGGVIFLLRDLNIQLKEIAEEQTHKKNINILN